MTGFYPPVAPLVVALHGVCPRCGQGKLFTGFLTLAPRCTGCGLALSSLDSGDGPAVFLMFALEILVVPLALWLATSVDWPLWLHVLVWGVVILGLSIGTLRPAKAYVVALAFRHRAGADGQKHGRNP